LPSLLLPQELLRSDLRLRRGPEPRTLLLPQELLLRIVVLPPLLPRLAACLLHQDLLLRHEQLRLRLR
jgi:hypothetical protein